MFLRELEHSVSILPGVGKVVEQSLSQLGIERIADLLLFYPRDYDDRSRIVPFAEFARHEYVNTIARVTGHLWMGYGRTRTLKIFVQDDTGIAVLVCFNRSFLEKSIRPGMRIMLTGKFDLRFSELQSTQFEAVELGEADAPKLAILPVYRLTESLKQGKLRAIMRRAVHDFGRHIDDELPAAVLRQFECLPKAKAIAEIHFPTSNKSLEAARRTLIFEELFYFQLAVYRRTQQRREIKVERPPLLRHLVSRLLERLPFTLTQDQQNAYKDIAQDLASPYPMARLLEGDVGSGKTLVAFLACLEAIGYGGQAALMAPTELLAKQHAATAARLLEPIGVRLAFLSGNVPPAAKALVLDALAKGEIDLVLGTHALFSEKVVFKNLSLVIVDEQHRFGVAQRQALSQKGRMVDFLMMSATPIPRTLALTVFGDLSQSVITHMPPGRKPIITHLASIKNEAKVYSFVKKQLEVGKQAYFIYPLKSESEVLELKNAEAMAQKLRKDIFPDRRVGLIHAGLDELLKSQVMEAFNKGELDILVATTVVEVGVDVPRATIMVIEHAERFGLAALHQLRGRVGRGADQSWCFLIYSEELTDEAKARLKALHASTDGFALAEIDLKIRGPGEFAGTAQSGFLRLSIADPIRDADVLHKARTTVLDILGKDPALLSADNAVIRSVIDKADTFGARFVKT